MASGKQKHKNNKVKQFLLFLGVAFIFWLLTNFSKQRVVTIVSDVTYTQIPPSAILADHNLKELTFQVNSSGFALLFHSLKKPTLEIPVGNYYQEGDSVVEILGTNLARLIEKQLKVNEVFNISQSQLNVFLDKTVTKKIPVKADVSITYKNGFRASNPPVVTPDSVLVTGPSEVIESIIEISTKPIKRQGIAENFQLEIPLAKTTSSTLQIEPSEVTVAFTVKEFTQKEITVPIVLRNVPEDVSVKLVPSEVTLSFDISIQDFSEVSATDFTVVCDYNERVENGSFMIPKIVEKPEGVFHLEATPRKIEFLIFK